MKRTLEQLAAAGFTVEYVPEGLVKVSRAEPFYTINARFPVTMDRLCEEKARWELLTPAPQPGTEFAYVVVELDVFSQLKQMQSRIDADRIAIATLQASVGRQVVAQNNIIKELLG